MQKGKKASLVSLVLKQNENHLKFNFFQIEEDVTEDVIW